MGNNIYDWVGDLTAHALQMGDTVRPFQTRHGEMNDRIAGVRIDRSGNAVVITGSHLEDSLLVEYKFRVSDLLDVSQEEINQHADSVTTGVEGARDDIEETIRAQKLRRIGEERLQDALDNAEDRLREIDSSIQWLEFSEDQPLWDGFAVQDRIYPGSDAVTLQEYNETLKQVINDGHPIAAAVYSELDELGEDAVPTESESDRSTTVNRMYE
jgi:PAS domain-containing protein